MLIAIDHGNKQIKTRCVALNEPGCKWLSMDGFDLLVSMIDCD